MTKGVEGAHSRRRGTEHVLSRPAAGDESIDDLVQGRLERGRSCARAAFHGTDGARGHCEDQSGAGRLSVDFHRTATAPWAHEGPRSQNVKAGGHRDHLRVRSASGSPALRAPSTIRWNSLGKLGFGGPWLLPAPNIRDCQPRSELRSSRHRGRRLGLLPAPRVRGRRDRRRRSRRCSGRDRLVHDSMAPKCRGPDACARGRGRKCQTYRSGSRGLRRIACSTGAATSAARPRKSFAPVQRMPPHGCDPGRWLDRTRRAQHRSDWPTPEPQPSRNGRRRRWARSRWPAWPLRRHGPAPGRVRDPSGSGR